MPLFLQELQGEQAEWDPAAHVQPCWLQHPQAPPLNVGTEDWAMFYVGML